MGLLVADDMSEVEQAILFEWTRSVADSALHSGYVTSRWSMTDDVCLRLRGYHQAGLSPSEAAECLFAVKH
jgi:hypothetical protein